MLFFMTFTAEESKKFTTIFKQHYKKTGLQGKNDPVFL